MLRLWKSSGIIIAGAVLQHNEEEASKKVVQDSIAYDSRSGWSKAMEYVKAKVKNLTETGKPKSESPTYEEMRKQYAHTLTGWDRLRIVFKKSEFLELDPNVEFIKNATFTGTLCGFFYGGVRDYTKAFNQFIETNDATKFASMNHAKRELSRVGLKAFAKGAYITSIKAFILTGTFVTTNTVVFIYRGKSGVLEWTIAGAVTSALLRWNLGIRGMISGCVRGGLTGTIMGIFIYCGLKLTGRTLSDVKFITYNSTEKSRKLWEEKLREQEYTNLEKIHAHITKDMPPGFPAN